VRESYAFQTALEVRKRLRQEQFDLVHAHYGYSLLPCLVVRNTPIVVSFCGSDLLGRIGSRHQQTLKGRILVAMSNLLSQRTSACVTKSLEMKRMLWFRRVQERTTVIPNAVDFNLFRPMDQKDARRELGLKMQGRYVLFAGRANDPRKRLDLIEEAMAMVRTEQPAAELLVASGVPQSRLPLYYSASDCLAMASIHEGSPNVIKEAMACNLPVVSTDVGDVREVIGSTPGCTVVPANVSAIARAIEKTLSAGIRTDGRSRIESLHPRKTVDRILEIYSSVLVSCPMSSLNK
jgi:teichuronic acid biosynthesis glycosyltransferase TuaC